MGDESAVTARDTEAEHGAESSPTEDPGQRQGLGEARRPHRRIAAGGLDELGESLRGGMQQREPSSRREHALGEAQEATERHEAQGDVRDEEPRPRLNENEPLPGREPNEATQPRGR